MYVCVMRQGTKKLAKHVELSAWHSCRTREWFTVTGMNILVNPSGACLGLLFFTCICCSVHCYLIDTACSCVEWGQPLRPSGFCLLVLSVLTQRVLIRHFIAFNSHQQAHTHCLGNNIVINPVWGSTHRCHFLIVSIVPSTIAVAITHAVVTG